MGYSCKGDRASPDVLQPFHQLPDGVRELGVLLDPGLDLRAGVDHRRVVLPPELPPDLRQARTRHFPY
jgi:hypothetical protein